MTPEILAKIMGIIAKTGERVIVVDSISGASFALMNIDEYERLAMRSGPIVKGPELSPLRPPSLTENKASGIIDPDLALWKETRQTGAGEWGGDGAAEEDRYYMEPAE
ncbi:hypothetical protein HYW17_03525 [Candidatus Uhrbacteria bacterium]|nr:hypothetical protein [Candidatus Uhrbacteria bacterium]